MTIRTKVALAVAIGLPAAWVTAGSVADNLRAHRTFAQARQHVEAADYLAVSSAIGSDVLYSDQVKAVRTGGRVILWESQRESFTTPSGRRCYERYTEWNRADAEDMRRSAAFAHLGGPVLRERDGTRVLSGRETSFAGPDLEWRIHLDSEDRPVRYEERAGYEGVRYSRWHVRRYEFLSKAQFQRRAGGRPQPLCPDRPASLPAEATPRR